MDGQLKQIVTKTSTTPNSALNGGGNITTNTTDYVYVVRKGKELALEAAIQFEAANPGSLTKDEFLDFAKTIYTWLTTE